MLAEDLSNAARIFGLCRQTASWQSSELLWALVWARKYANGDIEALRKAAVSGVDRVSTRRFFAIRAHFAAISRTLEAPFADYEHIIDTHEFEFNGKTYLEEAEARLFIGCHRREYLGATREGWVSFAFYCVDVHKCSHPLQQRFQCSIQGASGFESGTAFRLATTQLPTLRRVLHATGSIEYCRGHSAKVIHGEKKEQSFFIEGLFSCACDGIRRVSSSTVVPYFIPFYSSAAPPIL